MTLSEIQEATKADPNLQQLVELIREDWRNQANPIADGADQTQLESFWKVKDELTVHDEADVILCGNCIVIPTVL
jgi:hypothetical protein